MSADLTLEDIADLARWALEEHGLDQQGWSFGWDRATRRMGACHWGPKRITLSKPIYSRPANHDEVMDTIMHEVAHALAGAHADHGPVWKATAARLGARPERCGTIAERPPHSVWGACACGPYGHSRYRMPDQWCRERMTCRRCGGPVLWRREVVDLAP